MISKKALLFSLVTLVAPATADAAICNVSVYGDNVCDCGCGDVDPDCPNGTFVVCERSHCPAGEVPWEHSPHTCMDSACGDGWNDPVMGEVCDDYNALNSGGCAASCQEVTAGYECGANAAGCRPAGAPDAGVAPDAEAPVVVDAGDVDTGVHADASTTPAPDAGTTPTPDAGAAIPTDDEDDGGCTGSSSGTHLAAAGAAALLLRRRPRRAPRV